MRGGALIHLLWILPRGEVLPMDTNDLMLMISFGMLIAFIMSDHKK